MQDRLPKGIVALGFVSLFMDMSSEMIHGLLPLFVTGTLGASALYLGLIEGLGEATASVVKFFSGYLSDRFGRRKPLAILGYGLSALTKPLFAMAGVPSAVLVARVADRVGKGIRGAPRDALVADIVPQAQRGAAYGLRQSMDTVGAFAGPMIAIALLWAFPDNLRLVFALAIIPAILSVATLALFVREPNAVARASSTPRPALNRATLVALGRPFWRVTTLGALIMLARFSEAFLILRASDAGLPLAGAPLVLVTMNLVYAASAWPSGKLSDRIGVRGLLVAGLATLIGADLILAGAPGLWSTMAGIALWGLHMGLTQGLLSALIANAAPAPLRATAFGTFNLIGGLVTLVGNALAGWLWYAYGSPATFATGLGFALAALISLPVLLRPSH